MSYSTTTTTTTFLLATIFLIGLFEIKSIQSAKLQVPFQDLATPKPAISSKIYYLTESCSICEKFRPDFTRVKKPPGLNETSESEPTTEPKADSKPEPDDGETLKRVPRQTSLATKLKGDDPDKDIILLDYRKQSLNDSDLQQNGTWSWKKSFKKIHAKWIERKNDTSKKIQQDVVAKLKIEKTPEGEEKKKLVLEFKKKIQNLTSLNSMMMMIDEPYNAQEFEEEMLGDDEEDNKDGEKEKILVKREIKQIFLDPIKQPSIVIRSKRSAAIDTSNDPTGTDNPLIEMTTLPTQIFDENDQLLTNDNVTELKKNGTYEKCRLLIRLKANPEDIITDTAEEEEEKEKELDSKVVTEDKKETLPEPSESKESENVADSVEKIDEIKSLEKITDNVVVEKEKQPEKSSNVLEEPKMIEKVATKIEETVSDVVSPSSPAPPVSTLTKEEEKSTNTVEELKPILTIADDKKLIAAAAATTTKAETPIESSSPSSTEKVKEEVEAPKVTPKEVEAPMVKPEAVEAPMVKPEAVEAPKVKPEEVKAPEVTPKEVEAPMVKPEAVEAPKITPEVVKAPEVTPKETTKVVADDDKTKETSTISTVKVSTTEKPKPKPKPKSKPTNLQLGLLINIRKFVDGVFESIETDVNRSVTKKREIKKMNPFWKNVKIFTSDPEMTEFFYDGEKLTSLDNVDDKSPTKKSTDDGKLRRKRSTTTVKSNSFMDMVDMDDIVRLLSPNGTIDLNIADEKWILLERKIFFNDVDNDSDEELILNLYFKPKENEDEEMVDDGLRRSKKMKKALQCPTGTFDCNSDGHLCIPNSLICNGEDNCGNGHDEMLNCAPTLNMFYVKDITLRRHPISNDGNGGWFDLDPATEEMFWLGTRILFILFATSLFLYILLLLCRMCDRLRYPDNQYGSSSAASMFLIPKGNYISISGDTIERKPYQACQPKKSSTGKSSRMDNQGSKIHEYIYVNNNYGQPQGSTMVSTDVQPPTYDNRSRNGRRGNQHRRQSSDITTDDEYPPLYEETIRNYGTKK